MICRSLALMMTLTLACAAAAQAVEAPPAKPKPQAAATCSSETGSRIRHREGKCNSFGPQRVYSASELQATGEINIGDALKKLDPIFH